jgi:protein-S-isoprenylcysteine O-methyltransferase Ste14
MSVTMTERARSASPWWYRNRGSVIGAIFGVGFTAGSVRVDDSPYLLTAIVWGRHWGDAGVETLMWAGIALVLLAWFVRLAGTAYLRGDVVFAPNVQRDRLIVAGIFRYVRNPLYLGNDLLAAGIGLFATPLGFAIIVLGNVVFGLMLANEEVKQLGTQYGAEFDAYRRDVPAFIPRLSPSTLGRGATIEPSYRAAFRAESFALALAIALVPIAIFGQPGLLPAGILFIIAMGLFIAATRMGRRESPGP